MSRLTSICHPMKDYPLSSVNNALVEASPVDRVWAIGLAAKDDRVRQPWTWPGLNLLGE